LLRDPALVASCIPGTGEGGASRALASGEMTASGTETTILKVDGSINVTGPLETFADAAGVYLARELLAEFACRQSGSRTRAPGHSASR
jgi:carbon monoxide dehydrogenase subunit G